jgi:hypothetical protein
MSGISGRISRGKAGKKVSLKVKERTELTPKQWAEFKEKLKALAKQFGIEFEIGK